MRKGDGKGGVFFVDFLFFSTFQFFKIFDFMIGADKEARSVPKSAVGRT